MTRLTQADLWQNFIGDRLNDITQTFNEERYHELLIKQQNERIDAFINSLNEEQQAKFAQLDNGDLRILAEKRKAAYCAGLADGIRLMCSL